MGSWKRLWDTADRPDLHPDHLTDSMWIRGGNMFTQAWKDCSEHRWLTHYSRPGLEMPWWQHACAPSGVKSEQLITTDAG